MEEKNAEVESGLAGENCRFAGDWDAWTDEDWVEYFRKEYERDPNPGAYDAWMNADSRVRARRKK